MRFDTEEAVGEGQTESAAVRDCEDDSEESENINEGQNESENQ